MASSLHGDARRAAAALFESGPTGAHGCVAAGLSGNFGELTVDDAAHPRVAHLALDFDFFAGDPTTPAAAEMVGRLRGAHALLADSTWEPLLLERFGERLETYDRVEFSRAPTDRTELRARRETLPPGYTLRRVALEDVPRFTSFENSLTKNFRDADHFAREGFGWAVEREGEIVSGCSSFTIADGLVEIEIDTAPAHQRRGLALAAGAALVLHCLERGLEPCWDAANPASARLAEKLGFSGSREYPAWYARPAG